MKNKKYIRVEADEKAVNSEWQKQSIGASTADAYLQFCRAVQFSSCRCQSWNETLKFYIFQIICFYYNLKSSNFLIFAYNTRQHRTALEYSIYLYFKIGTRIRAFKEIIKTETEKDRQPERERERGVLNAF